MLFVTSSGALIVTVRPALSERIGDDTAIDAQGRAVGRARSLRTDVADQICHLFRGREALQQRRRPAFGECPRRKFISRRSQPLGASRKPDWRHLDPGRARQNRVYRYIGCLGLLRCAARDVKLRGFREAVMDHLFGYKNRGFAGYEHDAAPLLLIQHSLQIMPGKAHTAHDVDLEHPGPVIILDIEKRLWLVDSEIVDENVDLGELRDEPGTAFGVTKIEDGRMCSGARRCLLDLADRVSNCRRFPPVDDNFSAHLREPGGGSQSNASGRAGDKRNLSSQIEIHMWLP